MTSTPRTPSPAPGDETDEARSDQILRVLDEHAAQLERLELRLRPIVWMRVAVWATLVAFALAVAAVGVARGRDGDAPPAGAARRR